MLDGLRATVLEVLPEVGVAPVQVDVVACDEVLSVDVAPRRMIPEFPRPGLTSPPLGDEGIVDDSHAVALPCGGPFGLEELYPHSVQILMVLVTGGKEPVQGAPVHGLDLTEGFHTKPT